MMGVQVLTPLDTTDVEVTDTSGVTNDTTDVEGTYVRRAGGVGTMWGRVGTMWHHVGCVGREGWLWWRFWDGAGGGCRGGDGSSGGIAWW